MMHGQKNIKLLQICAI